MSLLMFKALADETRLRLVHILLHYELSVNELVQILGMGQSRVSRHLKILTEAGLLHSRRDGLWVFYSTPASGRQYEFLQAIAPFFSPEETFAADLALAAQMMAERAFRTRQFFNTIADDWDDLNREVLGDLDLGSHLLRVLPPDCRVAVDLGCGTGAVLEQLHKRAAVAIGVDGSARMLERCRARFGAAELANGEVSLRIGEMSHLPLADHEADFASINLVLHHLARPRDIFLEVKRIISPRGSLFISDFLRHNDESMRQRYGDLWLGFDVEDLRNDLQNCGFAVRDCSFHPVRKGLTLFFISASPAS